MSSLGLRASLHFGPISNILDSSAASVSQLDPPSSTWTPVFDRHFAGSLHVFVAKKKNDDRTILKIDQDIGSLRSA